MVYRLTWWKSDQVPGEVRHFATSSEVIVEVDRGLEKFYGKRISSILYFIEGKGVSITCLSERCTLQGVNNG